VAAVSGSICSRPGLWTIRRAALWSRPASAKGALKGTDEELRNGAIATAVNSDRFWLVRVRQPTDVMGRGALRLEAQWRSPELVVLARGIGPFTLAYGSAEAAIRLAAALGGSAESWLNMQVAYDLWHAEKRSRPKIERLRTTEAA
jgi:Protein of unknown function (DUF3999)